jgi:hypothetical protein
MGIGGKSAGTWMWPLTHYLHCLVPAVRVRSKGRISQAGSTPSDNAKRLSVPQTPALAHFSFSARYHYTVSSSVARASASGTLTSSRITFFLSLTFPPLVTIYLISNLYIGQTLQTVIHWALLSSYLFRLLLFLLAHRENILIKGHIKRSQNSNIICILTFWN